MIQSKRVLEITMTEQESIGHDDTEQESIGHDDDTEQESIGHEFIKHFKL